MENFYIMSWTTSYISYSVETLKSVFGPYSKYILCNLTKHHCNIHHRDMKKHINPTKDLSIIWDSVFMIDPTTVMRTLPSPPVRLGLQDSYKDEVNIVPDPAVRDLYLGIDPNPQLCPNAGPLRFDKTNTVLLDCTFSRGKPQRSNLLLVPEYNGPIYNQTDTELITLKDFLQTMATQYRAEFDKCENEGTEFHFSVQDYVKKNPFIDADPQIYLIASKKRKRV